MHGASLRSLIHIPWTHPGYIPLYTLHTSIFFLATPNSSSASFLMYCPLLCCVSYFVSFIKVFLLFSGQEEQAPAFPEVIASRKVCALPFQIVLDVRISPFLFILALYELILKIWAFWSKVGGLLEG
jgi:hypothetical protein